ncbi:MAG: PAS domain-containing sensor histidine kinase, partial [Campylobacterales bacterium]|nr:PAS domain-containing sensor histidine kinase [Campylobacterales bacterium]
YSNKFKNLKKDSTPFWVDIEIVPSKIEKDGEIIDGFTSIMYDISDEVLSESGLINALIDKSSQFEFAINSSRDGFWDYELSTKRLFLSKRWKKRLGFEEDEDVTYIDYISLIPQKDRFEHHMAMDEIMDSSDDDTKSIHFRVRYPIVTKKGEHLIIDDTGDIFFDDDKNPIRITGFHIDSTEHEHQRKIIETQNRFAAMGEMMSNIAHQWRQPITAINNALNELEFDIELSELSEIDSKTFLELSSKIKSYTKYLNDTIDDFRKISSDSKEKKVFDIKNSIEDAFEIVKSEYKKHLIEFLFEQNSDITNIKGYEREFKQVIINILNNAKDAYIGKDIDKKYVLVSIVESKENIKVYIQDHAGGVDEGIMAKIFDPYFTTKHQSVGTGLGLNMSKKIICDYFNGNIEVENIDGGARFIIVIPKNNI